MMRRVLYVVLALSLGINAGFLYRWAFGPPGPSPGPGDLGPGELEGVLARHLDHMSEGLRLSAQQRATIAAVLDEYVPRILEQNERVVAARRNLAETYEAEQWDGAAFRAAIRSLQDAQSELDTLVGEAMSGEAAVLTVEQRRRYVRGSPWAKLIGVGGSPPPRRR